MNHLAAHFFARAPTRRTAAVTVAVTATATVTATAAAAGGAIDIMAYELAVRLEHIEVSLKLAGDPMHSAIANGASFRAIFARTRGPRWSPRAAAWRSGTRVDLVVEYCSTQTRQWKLHLSSRCLTETNYAGSNGNARQCIWCI